MLYRTFTATPEGGMAYLGNGRIEARDPWAAGRICRERTMSGRTAVVAEIHPSVQAILLHMMNPREAIVEDRTVSASVRADQYEHPDAPVEQMYVRDGALVMVVANPNNLALEQGPCMTFRRFRGLLDGVFNLEWHKTTDDMPRHVDETTRFCDKYLPDTTDFVVDWVN